MLDKLDGINVGRDADAKAAPIFRVELESLADLIQRRVFDDGRFRQHFIVVELRFFVEDSQIVVDDQLGVAIGH